MVIDIESAAERLKGVVFKTPLEYHKRLSERYSSRVYLKREDLQPVRSYKIRGAYNMITTAGDDVLKNGVVCASAGNHAQGVAYTCRMLSIRGKIFMPANTPMQKVKRVEALGSKEVEIFLTGESYDECAHAAKEYCEANCCLLIPPFDHERIIEGQGTVALELLEDLEDIDYLFLPVGGGGLAAGSGFYFNQKSRHTVLIGVEPEGAASMSAACHAGYPVYLHKIDPFVDGAAVKKVGELNYSIYKDTISHTHTVAEGKICSTLLSLYNDDGIITEPAGSLAVGALDDFEEEIKGKTVVCIISGGNNDSNRMEEIKKLADAWEGLQHYLFIRFKHNPDGLKLFFEKVLGEDDHVNRIEYLRRYHGRSTYALVGLRCKNFEGYNALRSRLRNTLMEFREVEKEEFLFKYWV